MVGLVMAHPLDHPLRNVTSTSHGLTDAFGVLSPTADLTSTETMRKNSWRALLEGAPPRSA